MKLIEEADRFVSGESKSPEAGLRLAARLDKARQAAARGDQGLFEVARERLLVFLLQEHAGDLRVSQDKEASHLLVVRPPRGKRAPRASIGLDRVPAEVRETLSLELETGDDESVPGLDLRPIDAAYRAAFSGRSAGQCVKAGREAEAEYDYDRALAAYRLAVLRSGGDLAMVRELVRFLGEIYADYDEMAEVLSSSAIDVERDVELHLRLANATFQLGSDGEALEHYTALAHKAESSLVRQRLGALELRGGNPAEAIEHLERAVQLDGGNTEARRLLESAREEVRGEAEKRHAEAEAAFEAGDLAEARRICEAMAARGVKHAGLDRLRARLEAQERRGQAVAAVEEARALAGESDWREASQALRRARELDAEVVDAAADLVAQVEQALAEADCARNLDMARRRREEGDLPGALLSYARALDTGVAIEDDDALFGLLQGLYRREGKRPSDRQLDGLASLYKARQALAGEDERAAEAALREARRHLKDAPEVASLEATLEERRRKARRAAAQEWLDKADVAEQAGDGAGALAALDRAVEVEPGLAGELEGRRKALREAQRRGEALAALLDQLERQASKEAWWRVRRLVREASVESEETARYAQAADAAIEARWSVAALPPPPPVGRIEGVLRFDTLGLPEKYGARLLVTLDNAGGRLLAGVDDRLIVAELGSLGGVRLYQLPEGLRVDRATVRLFGWGERIVVFDAEAGVLTTLAPGGGGLGVEDRVEIPRLKGVAEAKRLVTEIQVDAATGRLLALLTDSSGRHDSRLLSVALEDGQLSGEERFSVPTFNLRPIGGTDQFTVQHLLDLRRMTPRMHNFSVVDGRSKVHKRLFYRDLDEPMHAIRKIARVPHEAGLLCHYWFMEPFSGQVIEQSNGMLQLKDDWSIYYQNSRPDHWLGDERAPNGSFAVHAGSESILLPWREHGKDGEVGIASLSVGRWSRRWSVGVPQGFQSLLEDRGRDAVYAVLREEGHLVIRRVDPEDGSLAGQ